MGIDRVIVWGISVIVVGYLVAMAVSVISVFFTIGDATTWLTTRWETLGASVADITIMESVRILSDFITHGANAATGGHITPQGPVVLGAVMVIIPGLWLWRLGYRLWRVMKV